MRSWINLSHEQRKWIVVPVKAPVKAKGLVNDHGLDLQVPAVVPAKR